jgi:hypothetical protein
LDNIFVVIVVLLIILALALWAISIFPLPMDPIIRWLLSFVCVAGAAYVIARKAGLLK